jgi:hypothetical protein
MSTKFCVLPSARVYREQEFVERCHCSAPATAACAACGRARCERHLARSLCNRCTQAIGREMERRTSARWFLAGATGTTFALGALVLHAATASIIGIPLGVATFFGLRAWQYRRLRTRMGPALSASKGELPPPPPDPPPFPDPGPGYW